MKKFIVFILIICFSVILTVPQEINKQKLDVKKYIEISDEVSGNFVQINWKYVASIVAVMNENNLDKIDDNEIRNIAKKFIYKENEVYKLNNLEQVITNLNITIIQRNLVYKYLDELKYHGVMPERLDPNEKYVSFIKSIKDGAIKNYKEHKILPSITIAQAILESGWGESDLSKNYNNLFGIKADSSWSGNFVNVETNEYYNQTITDNFRTYKNKEESISDHSKFLTENPRYKENGVFDANTYIYQANALEKAGYSTVENEKGEKIYAEKLIQLIRQYNLQLIDSFVQENN